MCTILHVRAHTHTHTYTYTHFVPRVNRRELDVNVPPFSFNRPLETVQRAFETREGEEGWRASETRRASSFSIGWKHPSQ